MTVRKRLFPNHSKKEIILDSFSKDGFIFDLLYPVEDDFYKIFEHLYNSWGRHLTLWDRWWCFCYPSTFFPSTTIISKLRIEKEGFLQVVPVFFRSACSTTLAWFDWVDEEMKSKYAKNFKFTRVNSSILTSRKFGMSTEEIVVSNFDNVSDILKKVNSWPIRMVKEIPSSVPAKLINVIDIINANQITDKINNFLTISMEISTIFHNNFDGFDWPRFYFLAFYIERRSIWRKRKIKCTFSYLIG